MALILWRASHPILFRSGFCAASVAVLMVVVGALNYNRFCIAEGRFLSEEEMIRAAVTRVAVGDTTYRYKDDHRISRSVKIARSATAEEFLAANPGCCRIVRSLGNPPKPSFVNRILGEISTVVEVDHVQQRPDSQGGLHAHDIRDYLYISPCGRACFD